MSSATSTLPAGWSSILDEMHLRLDQAIASANAHSEKVGPADIDSMVGARHAEIIKWCERMSRLRQYLNSAEQVVQSVDEALAQEETRLRGSLAASAALRQKLTQQPGGAIG